jgi:hypothetical protein
MQDTEPRAGLESGARAGGKATLIGSVPWRPKLKAFGTHLALSVLIFAAIIALTVWLWYPPPFFWIDGALHVTLLAAAVDIVAGPLLTFVVYRPGKPRLVMNLAVIAALQFGALAWGVQALYSQRPLLMAFVGHKENRFFPITEGQVRDGPRPVQELLALSPYRPAMVYIDLPEDPEKAQGMLLNTVSSVLRHTERFSAIDEQRLARIARTSRSAGTYAHTSPHFARGIEQFNATHEPERFAIIPLYGRFGYALLAISRSDGHIEDVVAMEISTR